MAEDDDPIIYLPHQRQEKDWIRSALEDASAKAQARNNSHLRQLDPILNMGPAEVNQFVRKCDSAMKSHATDFRLGNDPEAALSAFQSVMALLLEIRPAYPAEQAHIDEVLRWHGYETPER